MILKNTAIEMAWRYKKAIIIGLHPDTVDTTLSKPFQLQVQEGKIFTSEYSSICLLRLLTMSSQNKAEKYLLGMEKRFPHEH